jgi:predicted flap endonuclease-1-like 5' DNA nuclease
VQRFAVGGAVATVEPVADTGQLGEPDDLKLLVGIGPFNEQLLNEAGIRTFDQLANSTVERLQDILPDLHNSRVEREDWLGQASAFAEAKARGDDLDGFARDNQVT